MTSWACLRTTRQITAGRICSRRRKKIWQTIRSVSLRQKVTRQVPRRLLSMAINSQDMSWTRQNLSWKAPMPAKSTMLPWMAWWQDLTALSLSWVLWKVPQYRREPSSWCLRASTMCALNFRHRSMHWKH